MSVLVDPADCEHLFNVEVYDPSEFRQVFACRDCGTVHGWIAREAAGSPDALRVWRNRCADYYHELIHSSGLRRALKNVSEHDKEPPTP